MAYTAQIVRHGIIKVIKTGDWFSSFLIGLRMDTQSLDSHHILIKHLRHQYFAGIVTQFQYFRIDNNYVFLD